MADIIGTIQSIRRYAIKSMGPQEIDRAVIGAHGILGDRGYAVIDGKTNKVGSAKMPKKWGALLGLSSAYTAEPEDGQPLPAAQINWPDGSSTASDAGDADDLLSELLGRPVRLTTTKPEEISLERMDPLAAEETIADIGEIMMEGRFSDYAAMHMLTDASIAELSRLSPGIDFNPGRFRPNLVIEAAEGLSGFVENDWVGKTVCIGDDVRMRISDPTPRCLIPTQAQHGGIAKDMKVVSTILEHNKLQVPVLENEELPCVGVYGFITGTGAIRKGDPVRVE